MGNKIRMMSLFSGVGSFEKALTNIGAYFELLGFSEIDKSAIKAYCALHNVSPDKNLGDVSKIDGKQFEGQLDLLTYGFPCQDISKVNINAPVYFGGNKSSLFYEARRIIKECHPKVAIFENVETFKTNKELFDTTIRSLDELGYQTYTQVLDARDYGIPQSRRRVFGISIRNDIDQWDELIHSSFGEDLNNYPFPRPIPLTKTTLDFLEDAPELSLYLKDSQSVSYGLFSVNGQLMRELPSGIYQFQNGDIRNLIIKINKSTKMRKTCPTLNACKGHAVFLSRPDGMTVRYLSPLEYFRFMGYSDSDFIKIKSAGLSNSALYKIAGNSIVVPILESIFRSLSQNSLI